MTLRQWVCKEPITLILSSGFFGFYAHLGFVKALFENGVQVRAYRGTSSGALVAGLLASGHSIAEIEELLFSFQKKDFWDPGLGLGLLKGDKFRKILQTHLEARFQDLKTPLSISVFNIRSLKTQILNEGPLPDGILAACAVPGLFPPVKIQKGYFMDGAVRDPLALKDIDLNSPALLHDISEKKLFGPSYIPKGAMTYQIRWQDLPKSGPDKMHHGAEICSEIYRRTQIKLGENIR